MEKLVLKNIVSFNTKQYHNFHTVPILTVPCENYGTGLKNMNLIQDNVILQKVEKYVSSIFSSLKIIGPWNEAMSLPMYLQNTYVFMEVSLLGHSYILFFSPDGETEESVSKIRKHVDILQRYYGQNIIYLTEGITSFKRRDLIEQRVNFIVPGMQLYLPLAAIDFRETYKKTGESEKHSLSATAQSVVLMYLYGQIGSDVLSKQVMKLLGISKNNVSRAFNELISLQLVNAKKVGRNKVLSFYLDKSELWKKAQPYLINPVKKRVWADNQQLKNIQELKLIKSGESALSEYSMIISPRTPTYALNLKEWNTIKRLFHIQESFKHDEASEVELWRYEPSILSKNKIVDPLSLVLSLDTDDERIEIVKDEILEEVRSKYQWYKD